MPPSLDLLKLKAATAEAFVARRLKAPEPVILDVGANVGQSALGYLETFPTARILSFEPVPESFEQLSRAVAGQPRLRCLQIGLSDRPGTASMRASGTSTGNTLLSRGTAGDIEIRVARGADICREEGIDRVHLLKIDTEGHDMKVLAGFLPMLAERRIDYVVTEASMSRSNRKHVALEEFTAFFGALDYRLLGLFEQTIDRSRMELRRADPLFGLAPQDRPGRSAAAA